MSGLPLAFAAAPPNLPVHVQLELTWRCNWRCVHCYQDEHRGEALDTARLGRLWRELRDAGCWHLILTGGEPLVRADFSALVEGARAAGLAITLYTNGHLVDAARAAWLTARIAAFEVTLLAGTAAVHDELSGVRGSFARSVRGIEALIAAGGSVLVKTPLLRPALATLAALGARLTALGVEWAADREIAASYAGAASTQALALDGAEWLRFITDFPEQDPARRSPRASDPGAQGGLCRAGRQHAFIDALGNVYPCLSWKTPADRLGRGRVGSLLEASFDALWRDSPVVAEIKALDRAAFVTCARCAAGAACQPCMAANLDAHGTLTEPAGSICEETTTNLRLTQPSFVPASRLIARSSSY